MKRHSAAERRYMAWIARLPCIVTGAKPVQVAHVRTADSFFDKPITGIGRKPPVPWMVPLAPEKHEEQHRISETTFWTENGFPWEPAQRSILHVCHVLKAFYDAGDDGELAEWWIRGRNG